MQYPQPAIKKLNRHYVSGRTIIINVSIYGREGVGKAVSDLLRPKGSHSSRPPSGTVRGRWRSWTPVQSDFLGPVGSGTPSFVSLDRRVRCACAAPLPGRP